MNQKFEISHHHLWLCLYSIYTEDDSYEWRLVNDVEPNITSRGRLEVRRNHDNWGPICVKEDFENHYMGRDFIPEYIALACNTPPQTSVSFAWESLHVGSAIFDSIFDPPRNQGRGNVYSWPNWGNVKCHRERVLHLSCDDGMLKIHQHRSCKAAIWDRLQLSSCQLLPQWDQSSNTVSSLAQDT